MNLKLPDILRSVAQVPTSEFPVQQHDPSAEQLAEKKTKIVRKR